MPTRERSCAERFPGSCPSTRHRPAVARAVALEHLDGGRLAGAVGPQQAEDLAARDREVDPAQRRLVSRRPCVSPVTSIAGTPLVIASHHGNIAAARMLCGCIDIGTNTTRVLVAEARDGRPDARSCSGARSPAWAAVWRPAGTIPAARIAETAGVVAEQHALAEQAGARAIRAVATAVIRRAANRDEFCDAMREHGGVEVCVLDGEEEARLAFLGATRTLGTAAAGARRGRRRRRRLDRDRRRDARRRRRVVGVVRVRLAASSPTPTWAATRRRADELDAVRCHAARAARGHRPAARSTSRSRSAAAPPRCAGSSATSSTAQSLARALRVLTQRSGRGRRGALRPRRPAGAADARGPARARRRGARARPAAADRPRRVCARASCSTWRACNNSFTDRVRRGAMIHGP